ncbi:MAG: aminodeoxychorismate lyase [Hydrogenovibrio sp.]
MKFNTQIWLNGEPISQSGFDRGLLYGDGFFTTILLVDGQLANWDAHWARLNESQKRLGFPALNPVNMINDLIAFIKSRPAQPLEVIKILITRGEGGKGYQPLAKPHPSVFIQRLPFPEEGATESLTLENDHTREGIKAWPFFRLKMTVSDIEASRQTQLAGLKHLNRLENVLARQALLDTEFDEAVMLDGDGQVISATQANLVLLKGGRLLTPKLTHSGVFGTCLRSLNHALQASGFEQTVEWSEIRREDVLSADELFCCNALRGVMPVSHFQGRAYAMHQSDKIAQAWLNWQQTNLTNIRGLRV